MQRTPVRLIQGALMAALLLIIGSPAPVAAAGLYTVSHRAYYRVVETIALVNTSRSTAQNVRAEVVLLPPPSPYAALQLIGESRAPVSFTRDAAGNTLATFHWRRIKAGRTVTLTLDYIARTAVIVYHLPARYPSYTRTVLYRTDTAPALQASLVDTGAPALASLDRSLTPANASPLVKAAAYFRWIVGHVRYNYDLTAAGSALAVLQSRTGICTDFADLYVGMLRTAHIPAQLVSGYVTNNGGGQGGFHQWVQFWLPRVGWVEADPTWGQSGDFAALHDNWHIPLYVGARPDITVDWQYQASRPPYLHIDEHYAFTALNVTALPSVKPLPVLPPPASAKVRRHPQALGGAPRTLAAWERRLWSSLRRWTLVNLSQLWQRVQG